MQQFRLKEKLDARGGAARAVRAARTVIQNEAGHALTEPFLWTNSILMSPHTGWGYVRVWVGWRWPCEATAE